MSGRGRGRGGRGGGRGGMPQPVAKNDDGSIVQVQQLDGPPPLFPPIKEGRLPPVPDKLDQTIERQMRWRSHLNASLRNSQYFLRRESEGVGGKRKRAADFVQSYREVMQEAAPSSATTAATGGVAAGTLPYPVTMTLDPRYFPEELYTKQKRSANASAAEAAFWAAQREKRANTQREMTDQLALGKLDELARREDRGVGAGKGPGGKGGGEGEEGDEPVAEEFEEEEEDEHPEDDDYYQGDLVDDDEGYLDDYDDGGGGDEGPIF
ncbi:hypothetical protein D9Q98_001045 [Chlorella vulgaris]|uniref:DNA-directed RNA polymerase III subunit n=1 Tax=Chlorella vulgaris TaxID=3077 RepID=A0A9D4Z1S2_CHLVU|nr:hypothetical protein D9Q98_001045 [Chlorella vulgaris]